MKFAKLLLKTLIISTFLSVLFKGEVSVSEPQPSLSSKQQRSQKSDKSIDPQNITHQLIGSQIVTQFKPKNSRGENISLENLASNLGYEQFNWTNYVIEDPYGISDRSGQRLSTPYNDPPLGGYFYDPADKLPFYWDLERCLQCKSRHHWQNQHNLKQFELVFEDFPADYRLQPGEAIEFVTNLVGIKNYDRHSQTAEWEILHTFRWQLTNTRLNMSKVSLLETDISIDRLSPELLRIMQLDGAILNPSDRVINSVQSNRDRSS